MFSTLNEILFNAPDEEHYQSLQRYNTLLAAGGAVVNLLMGITFSMSIIGIAYSSFLYMVSQGDPKQLQKAQNSMVWSIVAAMVTLLAFAVKTAVSSAVGFEDSGYID